MSAVSPGPPMERIIAARVHHTRISTVRNTNAGRIGRALGSLRPTWVSGLIRYARNQHPNRAEARAWRRITRAVRARSPEAQFDVVLNARQYRNGRQLRAMMQRVRRRLDNDGWFFDFLSVAHRRRPGMIRSAVAAAHRHGEWIGGNVFGYEAPHSTRCRCGRTTSPCRTSACASTFAPCAGSRRRVPVVYHLHNDPRPRASGAAAGSSRT